MAAFANLTGPPVLVKPDQRLDQDKWQIGKMEICVKAYRKGDKSSASRIAQQITDYLYNTPSIPPHVYRFMRFNLGFFIPQGRHIVIVNNSDGDISPSCIRKSKNSAGSEEALLELGTHLAKLGNRVTIVGGVGSTAGCTLPSNNPAFYPIKGIKGMEIGKIDIVVAWRRTDFFFLKHYLKGKVCFVPHDWYTYPFDTKGLDGALFLTFFQSKPYLNHVPGLLDLKVGVFGNGFDPSHFEVKVKRNPLRCIYASNYRRGLDLLLDLWPDVLKAHPEARLDVYYGRETFGSLTQSQVNKLVLKMQNTPQVYEMGRVPHFHLAQALCTASLMLMPSDFLETFGISILKAQAAGCVPVVTNVFDRKVVFEEIELLDLEDKDLRNKFTQQTIQRLDQAQIGELEELRQKCKTYVNETYTWRHVAIQADKFFNEL